MALTIRTRLTLWYTGVLAIVLVVFAAGVLWLQYRFSQIALDQELEAVSQTTQHVLKDEFRQWRSLRRAAQETRRAVDIPDHTMAILDGNLQPVAAHWRGLRPADVTSRIARAQPYSTVQLAGGTWRVHVAAAREGDEPYYVVSAAQTTRLARDRTLLLRALLVSAPLAIVLAAAICSGVALRALAPLAAMAAQAEQMTATTLGGTPLVVAARDDEIGVLSRAFNRLIDRLAATLDQQRQFMADASHELRTPVSIARSAIEVTLSQPSRAELEYRESLDIVGGQTRRLERIVEDMLIMARADAGGFPVQLRDASLDDVVADAVQAMTALAARRGIELQAELAYGVPAIIDDTLVRQLVTNLLHNAIKYTPVGGMVRIVFETAEHDAFISVSDTGPGISIEDRERVFERFVRLDSNAAHDSGAGLGLPIARWIAQVHGGTLTAGENPPHGCRFVACLPVVAVERLALSTTR